MNNILNKMNTSFILNLISGKFTIADYKEAISLLDAKTMNSVMGNMKHDENIQSEKITEQVEYHKQIIEVIPIDQQKLDPNLLTTADINHIAKNVGSKNSTITIDHVNEFMKFIKLMRSNGPLIMKIMSDPAIIEKFKNGKFDMSELLKAFTDAEHK